MPNTVPFNCYLKMEQLPPDVKERNGIKFKDVKNIRLDCTAQNGTYTGFDLLVIGGMLKFYVLPTTSGGVVKCSDSRRAGYRLQGGVSKLGAINVSSIFYLNLETKGGVVFGYGEPNDKPLLESKDKAGNFNQNPMIPYKIDGYLFITDPTYSVFEILIVPDGRLLLLELCRSLANGQFDEALNKMRATAKPIFDY